MLVACCLHAWSIRLAFRRLCRLLAPSCLGRFLGLLAAFRGLDDKRLVVFPIVEVVNAVIILIEKTAFEHGAHKFLRVILPPGFQGHIQGGHADKYAVRVICRRVDPQVYQVVRGACPEEHAQFAALAMTLEGHSDADVRVRVHEVYPLAPTAFPRLRTGTMNPWIPDASRAFALSVP